jgi:hypothetical protein
VTASPQSWATARPRSVSWRRPTEAVAVMAGLTELGGAAESHEVADEDLEEAHAARGRQLLVDHQGSFSPRCEMARSLTLRTYRSM